MEPNSSSSYGSKKQLDDDSEYNLTEWSVKKAPIRRENTKSRRYSASYIRSLREDTRSFRSNITISSTASSPGYPFKDEIDPSSYSFSTALQALQARSGYISWECINPEGFALNSKWNEAEKYICNPLSGEVPLECLSAKTLNGRSFRNSTTNRITMSAPLVYSSTHIQTNSSSTHSSYTQQDLNLQFHIPEMKRVEMTRDAGTQSIANYLTQSSTSPISTAFTSSILEGSIKLSEDSSNSNAITEKEVTTKAKELGNHESRKKDEKLCRQGGCFSWMRLKRQRNNKSLSYFKVC